MTNHADSISLRFVNPLAEQDLGNIKKFIGLIEAKDLMLLINDVDLEANPRASKVGPVTKAIRESIDTDPATFPFKTKGLLLGTTRYERDANRVKVWFENRKIEGILDGGHNTLAIATHILDAALGEGNAVVSRIKTWNDLRHQWDAHRVRLDEFRRGLSEQELNFAVPVELIVPADLNDQIVVEEFAQNLLDICAARNNNAALKEGAKANQAGFFDVLRDRFDPKISELIEWKTNDGGSIKVEDVVALAWVPLSVIDSLPNDENGNRIDKPKPQTTYSGKGQLLGLFNRLMNSPEVFTTELRNPAVLSALQVTADLPELYDYIQIKFADAYNAAGGKYKGLNPVKALNKSDKGKPSKYTGQVQLVVNPEGYIAPMVYGLQALMEFKNGKVEWKTDPKAFLINHLDEIVAKFMQIINLSNADPQIVGKGAASYATVLDSYKIALLEER